MVTNANQTSLRLHASDSGVDPAGVSKSGPSIAHGPTASTPIEVFSTCPSSNGADATSYSQRVIDVARWSEEAGCHGILVYTDNSLVDPWLVSQLILENTNSLSPLVAVQPAYMHPYAVAKAVTTLGFLHGRRVFLNMVAGGFKNDLAALNDLTPHDERYDRLIEYTQIVQDLLANSTGITREGKYYQVKNLRIAPELPPALFPGFMISGSSDTGIEAARATGAMAIKYPKPPGEELDIDRNDGMQYGVRIGIVSRADGDKAWQIARQRFPEDRKGKVTHKLAMKVSDSKWHQQLSQTDEQPGGDDNPYWLGPFHNYKTFCPYLVGSHDRIAHEIATYISHGYRTFILDIPPDPEELEHTGHVFRLALQQIQP